MTTNDKAGLLPVELATPVTDLSKCAQGEPLSLQDIYERVTGVRIVTGAGVPVALDQIVPISSDGTKNFNARLTDQLLMDELQALLDTNETAIRGPAQQPLVFPTAKQESTMASQDSIPASRAPMTATEHEKATKARLEASVGLGSSIGSAAIVGIMATPASVLRRNMLENVSEAHNATRAAVTAMTDLISKMFGAEAAKAAAESYTGIGPMPAAEAGIAVNIEYMLRDISEMAQKIEAQARVLSGELG